MFFNNLHWGGWRDSNLFHPIWLSQVTDSSFAALRSKTTKMPFWHKRAKPVVGGSRMTTPPSVSASKVLRDPRSGRPYPKSCFSVAQVSGLLSLVDTVVPLKRISTWSADDLLAAGYRALRTHLRASDNSNRVPPVPECVRRDRVESEYG